MPNPYTGTDNDPFGEAQHRYLGPEWERFFGSLAGKRVSMAGFGQPGRTGSLAGMQGSLGVGPTPETDASETARTQAASDYVDNYRAQQQNLRAMTAQSDLATVAAKEAQGGLNDREALDRAMQGGVRPSPIAGGAGNYLTLQPDPNAPPPTIAEQRARVLAALPGHLRPTYEQAFAAQDDKTKAEDLAIRKQTEVERENRAKDAANAPFVSPVDAQGVPVTGPAVLQTLPLSKQKLVTAVLEGRQAIPSGTALKDPYWKGVLETANLIDPNFDTVNFNSRANTRKDFTSGKSAGQINAINTVVGHLHDLAGEGERLGNFGYDWANAIYNKLTPGGSKRGVTINNFNTLKEGVGTELMRLWRQAGVGSEREIEDWKSTIDAAKSPEELRGAFSTVGGMLESKLDALDSQYKQGMGTDKVSAITSESRKKLDALQGVKGGGGGGSVKLQAPDGSVREVPADQVDHYLQRGAKRVGG